MGRLPIIDPDDPGTDPVARALLLAVRQNLQTRGEALPWQDINVYSAMANHPKVLEGLLTFGSRAYSANTLTPAQRELAYLGASVANDCHY